MFKTQTSGFKDPPKIPPKVTYNWPSKSFSGDDADGGGGDNGNGDGGDDNGGNGGWGGGDDNNQGRGDSEGSSEWEPDPNTAVYTGYLILSALKRRASSAKPPKKGR